MSMQRLLKKESVFFSDLPYFLFLWLYRVEIIGEIEYLEIS